MNNEHMTKKYREKRGETLAAGGTMPNGSPVWTHSWRIWDMYFVKPYGNNFYFLQTFLSIKMIDSTVLQTK